MNRFIEAVLARRQQIVKWSIRVAAAALVLWLVWAGTGYRYRPLTDDEVRHGLAAVTDDGAPGPDQAGKILAKTRPRGVFIVIDRYENRLWLRDGDKVLLDAVISAGAGSRLENPAKKEDWVFETPIGRFSVTGKRRNPVWTAPDWEFVETGQPIPSNYGERVQTGMLGEYALDLNAPGYMIHGTLYTRLLGRNVSHGCIRVGRDDLRVLWKQVPPGTPVFIF